MKLGIEIAGQRKRFEINALEAFEKYGFHDGAMPGAVDAVETILGCLRENLPAGMSASIVNTCGHNDYIIILDENKREVDIEEFFSSHPELLKKIQKIKVEIDFY